MSENKENRREKSAYTAPAEDGIYQFSSGLGTSFEAPPPREKGRRRGSVGLVIAGILILLIIGAVFCALVLHITVSFQNDGDGFSIRLERNKSVRPIVRVEAPGPAAHVAQTPSSSGNQERFEWTGEPLQMSQSNRDDELSFRQLYADCAPCIGILQAVDGLGRSRMGAVIVMSEDGAVIASTHVISGASSITVLLDGEEYEAHIVGLDYATDLSVLKLDAKGLPTATFSGEQVSTGDTIAVIGNPVGSVVNITGGMVSAVNPRFDYRGFRLEVLQFGMNLSDIASGSALVNASGQVIGIVNCDMAAQLSDAEGIGFAISMHEAKGVIDELLMNGFVAGRPSSGLTVSELPAAYAAYYEYPTCLYISSVQEDSTAAEAGLQRGDLILSANGVEVNSVSELYAVINGLRAGDWLTLGVCRDGENGSVSFQLMEAVSPAKQ